LQLSLLFAFAVAFSCHPSPKAEDLLFAIAFVIASIAIDKSQPRAVPNANTRSQATDRSPDL